ncbi:putative L-aspartate dehydrogenase isoform X1 [Bufo bufo]|uniref:putative L-aspartate dehydrogenase isoform X1 n=1 Tax=Bufo bufo TaxID=8384 RepID=UPI001ABE8E79|nr:putative L-aspartate dehydrogenase isoform X1 [Bufo bufo]XP_040267975.1 putative L-aspartate dehydrogenase isoform X1 [Bufo bufo]
MSEARKCRIGIVGYGHVGAYLVNQIQSEGDKYNVELAFVWNRTMTKMEPNVAPPLQLQNLEEFEKREVDLIVEVAHPSITRTYGERFLCAAHLLVGSPTALADEETERRLRRRAKLSGYTLYIPSGALWGGEDIMKMAARETLRGLKITMTKHPKSFKLEGKLAEADLSTIRERTVLYEGPTRSLCEMAPNNVNTMAAASLAAHNLGFDKVIGVLVADPSIPDWHLVDIEVTGETNGTTGQVFSVTTRRRNPAAPGAVTGTATFGSFWSSILVCKGHGGQVFLC